MLLERTSELATIDRSIASAIDGSGVAVVVEGEAGVGKSSLLEAARHRASTGGMKVLSAQGAALEQEFGFGVVRQLFERTLRDVSEGKRRRLLSGAAALAAPVLWTDEERDPPLGHPAPIVHGLYWLTAGLADDGPVLVSVDDAHDADAPSLRFLAHLVRRLDGVPVFVVAAIRSGEPAADAAALAEIIAAPGVRVLRPSVLSRDGVADLVEARLGAAADDAFVEACRTASGGVPYLVEELLAALDADHVAPTADAIARIAETGPRTVANATMLRLSRVSLAAIAVTRATAVWGPHARLDRISGLAHVGAGDAREAIDALIGLGILAQEPPVRFAHPLVRQAIYDDLAPAWLAAAHGEAAEILIAEGAPVEEVAAHVLLIEPLGRSDVIATLHEAAGRSLRRGAPQSAVAYLRRALAEGGSDTERIASLHALGRAEALAQDGAAAVHLEEVVGVVDDPIDRARALYELSEVCLGLGQWGRRLELLQEALDALDGHDPDLEARLEAARSGSELYDPARLAAVEPRLPRLREIVDEGTPGSRALALVLGAVGAFRGDDRNQDLLFVERGLDDGGLLRDEGSESLALPQAVAALIALDEPEMAARATEGVLHDARRRGSVGGFITGSLYRLAVDAHRGNVKSAEADVRSAVELSLAHGVTFALPGIVCFGMDVFLERPELDDLASLLTTIELDPSLATTSSGAWLLSMRGRLRFQRGEHEAAATDLRAAGEIFEGLRFRNPILARWRSPLALALPREQIDEARGLVDQELRDATSMGLARSRGVAACCSVPRGRGAERRSARALARGSSR